MRARRRRGEELTVTGPHAIVFVLGREAAEGYRNGNEPVLKTGALAGLRVRIPPPPPDARCESLSRAGSYVMLVVSRGVTARPGRGRPGPVGIENRIAERWVSG